VASNEKVFNPNVTMFEWLNQKPELHGHVAAFGAWDVFPWIFNAPRSGLPVNAGWVPFPSQTASPELIDLRSIIMYLKQDNVHKNGH
jgi:hypothetical protein